MIAKLFKSGNASGRKNSAQQGSILLSLVLVLPFLILILAAYMSLTTSGMKLARTDMLRVNAQLAVDAGIDAALSIINQDDDWAGTEGEVELRNADDIRTTYEVEVFDTDEDRKEIAAVGRSYTPADSPEPTSTVRIMVDLRPVKYGGYSLVSGVGGLSLKNNSRILGGNVYINGKVDLINSAQIGLTTNPVNMHVAHQSCPNPPSANYPQVCASGENGEPISIKNNARIYGDVKANNQTNGNGMTSPGLTASSGVAPLPLPEYDREAHKAAVAVQQSGSQAGCSGGTKTWPANLKVNGDVRISNGCNVIIEGDVWITGSLRLQNSSRITVSESLGETMPVVMVDGSEAQLTNSSRLVGNSHSTGLQIITFRSNASCSPDCTEVTGPELASSQNLTTISLSNSSAGPNSIFYAKWSKVSVGNSGEIGALIGQTVELTNSSAIVFDTGSAVEETVFWVIDGYRRVF